jgi:hypothetical protein
MSPLYRKKPVIVQARGPVELGNPQVMDSLTEWCGGRATIHGIVINTPEGESWARQGYMIIQGVDGKFYPVRPEVFLLSYETLLTVRKGDILIGPVAPMVGAEMQEAVKGW